MVEDVRRRPHRFVESVAVNAAWRSDGGPFVHVVLVEPEIPQNTGTIVRLCAATACPLHLVEPFGFSIDDRALRRAGLDYWEHAVVSTYRSWPDLRERHPDARFWLTSTRARRPYTQVAYRPGDFVVFGRETTGLPERWIEEDPEHAVVIPMFGPVRSLNLANAVSVVVYEALRQLRAF